MALSFAEVLARFGSAKRVGQEYQAFCPVHETGGTHKTKSLSIREGDTHVALLLCRSQGCATKAILDAVGLTWDDISAPRPKKEQYERVHIYRDEHGAPLYRVTVERHGDGQKDVRQWRYDAATDRFIRDKQTMKGVRLVPYRLHDLHRLRPTRIFIPEGEQKCDRLWKLDLPATCNSGGGTQKWRESDTAALKAAGCAVAVLLPDNDPVGLAHIQDVATSLEAAGIHAYVTPPLPDVAPSGDVVDWLKYGHTKADLLKFIEDNGKRFQTNGTNGHNGNGHRPLIERLVPAAVFLDIIDPPQRWIVENILPAGGSALLFSKPKVGKSITACALAASVVTGREWLGFPCAQGPVWYFALEGAPRDYREKFRRLGVARDAPLRLFSETADATLYSELLALAATERPLLIVVDVIQHLLRLKEANSYEEGALTAPMVKQLVDLSGASFLGLHHGNKSGEGREISDAVLGSTGIAGGFDNLIQLQKVKSFRTIRTQNRLGVELEERLVRLDEDTGRVTLGPARKLAVQALIRQELLDVITDATEDLTLAEWLPLVDGYRRQEKLRQVTQLERDGLVIVTWTGRRGDAKRYRVTRSGEVPKPPEPQNQEGETGELFEC